MRYARKSDIGKYVKLDDGSQLYVRIEGVTNHVIKTNCGMYRRWDLVHVSHPRDPETSVCGIKPANVHPLVRGYTISEKSLVERILQNPDGNYNMSKRVKMLTLDKINERMKHKKMDEDELVDLIIESARDMGMHFKWSMTLLMRAKGMDANEVVFSHMNKGLPDPDAATQRITRLPNGTTITENKLPSKRSFTKMMNVKED
jgi:hypothetical protein